MLKSDCAHRMQIRFVFHEMEAAATEIISAFSSIIRLHPWGHCHSLHLKKVLLSSRSVFYFSFGVRQTRDEAEKKYFQNGSLNPFPCNLHTMRTRIHNIRFMYKYAQPILIKGGGGRWSADRPIPVLSTPNKDLVIPANKNNSKKKK